MSIHMQTQRKVYRKICIKLVTETSSGLKVVLNVWNKKVIKN